MLALRAIASRVKKAGGPQFSTGAAKAGSAHSIALIPGDGIGVELMDPTLDFLAATKPSRPLETTHFPWSCEYYHKTGAMMPESGLADLAPHSAILLGAVGWPKTTPDHVSLRGLLVKIRQGFDLAVNVRPAFSLPLPKAPKPNPAFDLVIVRENSEGEYAGMGGSTSDMAIQTGLFTRKGVSRVAEYAADLAVSRRGGLVSATKSNAMQHSMVFWDKVIDETLASKKEWSELDFKAMHVDALAAAMVTHIEKFDVVVATNLFGDILSDLAGAMQGSLGLPASANLDLSGRYPSMFESVAGSAPDIVGKGIANPLGSFYAGVMMLDHLGEKEAAGRGRAAIMTALETQPESMTPDIGGRGNTESATKSVIGCM